ncbi:Putative prophage membrane protein [Salmonella bongori N268-08]|uniref:Putative prophage membrane protein n=2 Tax=Salmonella bongori TaxID=54736 RepID=S5MWJ1_SALBN|nr:Putative prophage membrane protein [Salmonella bongori N268-08]
MGASVFGLATGTDYGVVFGAFAGVVFYVATATNIGHIRLVAYFITSFIVGVLGAVIISAMCIKFLTFLNSQDLNSLFSILSRIRGGGSNGSK